MRILHQYPKEIKVFLAASLINAIGSALMWPLVTMFVFDELGRSMTDAGFVILIQSIGGIAGQLLGGALYHKVGVKKLIIGALALNAAGLLLLPVLSHNWPVFIAMMGLIGLFNALSMPAIQAFIGFRFADQRGELFNIVYVANNIGVAIGTALSGFLADISYSLSFSMNGVTSAIFAIFFLFYLKQVGTGSDTAAVKMKRLSPQNESVWALLLDVRVYLFMAVGAMLLNLGNSIWNTGVSPFIISEGLPKQMFGYLWTLNGILIFVAQPLIGLIKRLAAQTITAQLTASALFYLSGYAAILMFHSFPGMVLGMVLTTFGEMLIAPAIPAFLSENGGKQAPFYLGLAGGIGSAGRVLGPYMMGHLYDIGQLTPVAWLAVITATASALFFVIHSLINQRWMKKQAATEMQQHTATVSR
ncbi:MFS transporter [Paenibacillus lignilyticus]|uniref:MFS transporter n=1 Tax=Paenibacillus lignilyticus TaxID=1172615 RepID=A0ABS5CCG1_9BACL|nr:MFS transporter [Paenibacillus lignilyticus]MBP3961711.1 MFS transporter [Paenibacillus lignilyticus]MBP3963618.1 MFS transporter [Paenibacillus lignilyticus]